MIRLDIMKKLDLFSRIWLFLDIKLNPGSTIADRIYLQNSAENKRSIDILAILK